MAKKNDYNANSTLARDDASLHKNLPFACIEQYKMLRANLSFTIPDEVKCPVVGITSTDRSEGKSTTAINLAFVLAEQGKKVLLIDGDLRLPSIAKKMNIQSKPGLSNMLSYLGNDEIKVYRAHENNKWFIMPSGELPPNPSELLGSKAMGQLLDVLKQNFDFIIIDLPPAGIVSDALAVAKYLTGIIVVVREEYSKKTAVDATMRALLLSNVKILGFVTTAARKNTAGKVYKSTGSYGAAHETYGAYYSIARPKENDD